MALSFEIRLSDLSWPALLTTESFSNIFATAKQVESFGFGAKA
jgi:hypothetical protein